MRINWVYSSTYNPPLEIDLERVKAIGPTWGSWRSWRSCQTDNVVCHDFVQNKKLLGRAFQAVCNFYVPKEQYQELGRPIGVKLYDGNYTAEVDNIEDIIAMHLVAATSDIVLMCGFDLSSPEPPTDRFEQHKLVNRHGLMHGLIKNTPNIQWVIVDHPEHLAKAYKKLENITCDTMENALQLLA